MCCNSNFHVPSIKSIHNPKVASHRRLGFTLVELMVVIVLIGLLAGAVTVSVRSYLVSGKQNVAKMEIANITQALQTYYSIYDRYPNNQEGLEILRQPSDEFVDGLITKIPLDPWKNPYQYNQPGPNGPFEIVSFGADGQEGGDGAARDISSDDLKDQ